MNDDYVHAKRNDKAVPLNSRRRKNGRKASHIFMGGQYTHKIRG